MKRRASLKLAYPIATPDTKGKMAAYRGEPEEVLASLKAIGYSGIEPCVRDPKQMDVNAFGRAVERNGFEIAAVGTGPVAAEDKMTLASPDENVRQAAIERTKSVIDFAALFKTQVIIGKLRGDIQLADVGKSWEWMKRGFQILCEYASTRQVRITIEPQSRFAINNLNTMEQACALVRELGLPNLNVMSDT
jgi:5-keto-L-gluconate epimerase